MVTQVPAKVIGFHEGAYVFRGTRAAVGTFDVIAIDVSHPNYGYFAEFMAFWRSPHSMVWQAVQVHAGSCDMTTCEDAIARFPNLAPLFDDDNG